MVTPAQQVNPVSQGPLEIPVNQVILEIPDQLGSLVRLAQLVVSDKLERAVQRDLKVNRDGLDPRAALDSLVQLACLALKVK